jgi:Tfp pilus assembly major pilin PilA
VGKLKNNQQGFSAVEAVMSLVIVALIIVVGFMVYKNHHKPTVASVSTTASKSSALKTKASSSAYSGWNNYKDTSGWFTLKYPTNWTNDTAQAGSTVSEGLSQTSTTLSSNGQGELTPNSLHSQTGPDILTISTDTYSGTIETYLADNSGSTTQNKNLTLNGYEAHYEVDTNSGGNTYRTYLVFNKGKVATLNFLLSTPTSFAGDPPQNFSQYSSVEDQIANSIDFVN